MLTMPDIFAYGYSNEVLRVVTLLLWLQGPQNMQLFSLFYLYIKMYHFNKFDFFLDKPQCGLSCTSLCNFQDGLKLGSVVILS